MHIDRQVRDIEDRRRDGGRRARGDPSVSLRIYVIDAQGARLKGGLPRGGDRRGIYFGSSISCIVTTFH
jgi:hypothetical protein